jgi:hypothetical protein
MSEYYDAIIYVILASIIFIFLIICVTMVEPVIALFIMSGIAVFCFNILSLKSLNKVYCSIFQNPLLFLASLAH